MKHAGVLGNSCLSLLLFDFFKTPLPLKEEMPDTFVTVARQEDVAAKVPWECIAFASAFAKLTEMTVDGWKGREAFLGGVLNPGMDVNSRVLSEGRLTSE